MTGFAALKALEGERLSCRGEKLLTVHYAPSGEPRAVLIWHHGYGEHIGRYKWGARMCPAGSRAVNAGSRSVVACNGGAEGGARLSLLPRLDEQRCVAV